MAKKHQYKISSKSGRSKAGRKWRRQQKKTLGDYLKGIDIKKLKKSIKRKQKEQVN